MHKEWRDFMNTVLVTGGAGFIGSNLCESLLLRGNKIINIDSFSDYYNPQIKRSNVNEMKNYLKLRNISHKFYDVKEGDIRDYDFLSKVFMENQIDAVVHLAAYAGVRPSIENPVLYTDVNINGTVNILECMKKYGVKKHVFASSSSVYGNNKKVPFSEDDYVDNPISPYAATKKAGELFCHTYHHLYDINTACLRFFTVYGARQRPDLAIHKFTKLILEGKPIPFYGDGSTQRDYTYIDDILDGIIKALYWVDSEKKRFEIFNLGESNTISLSEMVRTIEDALGIKAQLDIFPIQPGDVETTFADISKAKRILGYDPHTIFKDGIREFVDWYRKKKA